jgi:fructose-specific phosphotransferase system component IIB
MKPEQMSEALEGAATKLGVAVKYETLGASGVQSGGGLCKVRGQWWVIVDKKATAADRVSILTEALAGFPTDELKLPEKVREALAARRAARTTPPA